MYKIFKNIVIIITISLLWYLYMSFNDWILHKYILHNDDSPLKDWRKKHIIHHKEFNNEVPKNGVGIAFTYLDSLLIAFVTGIPILILGCLILNKKHLLILLIGHFIGSFIGVGIHNYSHCIFHKHKDLEYCLRVPVPKDLYIRLHEHHEQHHNNTKTNYCTVFLGFDKLTGTNS